MMFIHMYQIMFVGQVQSSNKMTSHCFLSPSRGILRLGCGPSAAANLRGRGVARYFDSLQHVARGPKRQQNDNENDNFWCQKLSVWDTAHF